MIDNKYDDIINMSGPINSKHPKMSPSARAAQFAPFAALVGYDNMVEESGIEVEKRRVLDPSAKEEISKRLQMIVATLEDKREVTIVYFVQDPKRPGGKYLTTRGFIDYIDESLRVIVMENKEEIFIDDIYDIDSDIFFE